MLDFDAGKLIVIGVVALVVIGPKDLPRVMRQVGQTVGKLRRMASEFQSQFMEAMREADMADVKAEMGKIAETAKIDVAFDPVRDIRNQITGSIAGETQPHETASLAEVLPETSGNSIDLTALESASAPASGGALEDGGLVGAGIAPAPELKGETVASDVTKDATLDDVRPAPDEKLESATVIRTEDAIRPAQAPAA